MFLLLVVLFKRCRLFFTSETYGTRSTAFGGLLEGGDAYNVNDTFTAGLWF